MATDPMRDDESRAANTLILLLDSSAPGGANSGVAGVTRLMKLLFLADVEGGFSGKENFTFQPYKYGPFAPGLYDDLRLLRDYGLLEITYSSLPDYYQMRELQDLDDPDVADAVRALEPADQPGGPTKQWRFALTPDGRQLAARLREQLEPERWKRLAEIKRRFNHIPLNELLAYVYERYPEWAEKSVHPLAKKG